jgi:hypothetical protein
VESKANGGKRKRAPLPIGTTRSHKSQGWKNRGNTMIEDDMDSNVATKLWNKRGVK